MKVYYNSACPICNSGIENQKVKLREHAIEWHDIHSDVERRGDLEADVEFVRERLHLIDDNGEVQVGIDALIALEGQSPKASLLKKILSVPGVHTVGVLSYNTFARCLYKTNRLFKNW